MGISVSTAAVNDPEFMFVNKDTNDVNTSNDVNTVVTETSNDVNESTDEIIDVFNTIKTIDDINNFIIKNNISVPELKSHDDILHTITKINFDMHQSSSVLLMQFKSFLTLYYYHHKKDGDLFDETTRMFLYYYESYTAKKVNRNVIDNKIAKLVRDLDRYLDRNNERDWDELKYEFNNYISARFFKLYDEINHYLMDAKEFDEVLVRYQSLFQMFFH